MWDNPFYKQPRFILCLWVSLSLVNLLNLALSLVLRFSPEPPAGFSRHLPVSVSYIWQLTAPTTGNTPLKLAIHDQIYSGNISWENLRLRPALDPGKNHFDKRAFRCYSAHHVHLSSLSFLNSLTPWFSKEFNRDLRRSACVCFSGGRPWKTAGVKRMVEMIASAAGGIEFWAGYISAQ